MEVDDGASWLRMATQHIENHVPRDLPFFFFQAEDGIRDLTVTGVQTCALPIYLPPPGALSGTRGLSRGRLLYPFPTPGAGRKAPARARGWDHDVPPHRENPAR